MALWQKKNFPSKHGTVTVKTEKTYNQYSNVMEEHCDRRKTYTVNMALIEKNITMIPNKLKQYIYTLTEEKLSQ